MAQFLSTEYSCLKFDKIFHDFNINKNLQKYMNGKCIKYYNWIQLLTQNAVYKSFQEQHGCSHKILTPANVALLYNNRSLTVQGLQDTQAETLVIQPNDLLKGKLNDSLSFIKKESDEPLDLSKKKSTTKEIVSSKRKHLVCFVCNKTFDRPSLLKRHHQTHTGEKPHLCEICKKRFSTSSSLNTHRRIHFGDKPHQCQICGKRFTASSNLYYHRMTHMKNKPHKCQLCIKSFSTPGDLRVHQYTHSGVWPFNCHVCYRGFAKHTSLRKHLYIHIINSH